MTTILDQLKATNNIVFDVDYRQGSIADRSPYAAAATVTTPVAWARTRQGYGVRCTGTGKITYADNTHLRLVGSPATWILFGGPFQKQTVASRLLSKRDASGTDWDLKINTSADLVIFDGTNASVMTGSIIGKRLIAVTLVQGAKPKLYLDGVYVADGSLTCTVPTNLTPPALVVASFYSVAYVFDEIVQRALILNTALTAKAISQLYQELADQRFPLRAYSFGLRVSPPQDPPGVAALLKCDFTTKLGDGRLADLSGNGWHGTIKPGFYAGPGMCGNSLMAAAETRSYVDFGDVTPINGATKLTVVWCGSQGAKNPTEILIDKGTAANNRLDINASTTQVLFYNGNAKYASMPDTTVSEPSFRAFVYDGTLADALKVKMCVDNAWYTPTISAGFPSTLLNNVGTSLVLGRLSWANSYPPHPKNELFALYSGALTQDQVGSIYRQIARRQTFRLDMQRVPVSLANLVGPCEVPGTPFRLQTGGTWKISEDAKVRHWFETVAGDSKSIYMPSAPAFGTWVFSYQRTANSDWIAFISNSLDLNYAARNHYAIRFTGTTIWLYKLTPGSGTVLFRKDNAVANGVAYTIAVTRDSSGQFYVYLKSETSSAWTLVLPATAGTNPVIDTAYTTSKYFLMASDVASGAAKFGSMRFFQGAMPIEDLPND